MSQDPPKLNLFSFAKLLAVIFALLGLGAGILYSFGGLIYDLITTGSLNPGTALAFLALIGMPLLAALLGWITGILGAVLFNQLPARFRPSLLDNALYYR